MGQGCNSGCSNYFVKLVPDTGVQYTGPAIPSLSICTGDLLSEVDAVILQKIIDYSTGVGISIPSIDLTTCAAFVDCTTCCGTCTDLPCLLECYKNAICTIFEDVADIKTIVDGFKTGYDVKCLTGVTSTSLVNVVLQELITEFCALVSAFNVLNTTVSGFTAGINTTIGNFLAGALTSCQTPNLGITGSGASLQFHLKGSVPIGTIMMAGSGLNTADFDATGLGRTGTSACGWAFCNGNNGTDNMSGLMPVGTGMGPAVITGLVLPYNSIGGEYAVSLTASQAPLPVHSHTVNEGSGHSHPLNFGEEGNVNRNGGSSWHMNPTFLNANTAWYDASTGVTQPATSPGVTVVANIGTAKTGISINNAGGGSAAAHTNMPPYRALYFIQRVS